MPKKGIRNNEKEEEAFSVNDGTTSFGSHLF
jgi:hypothetical protein